jgi:hypothetical protein
MSGAAETHYCAERQTNAKFGLMSRSVDKHFESPRGLALPGSLALLLRR